MNSILKSVIFMFITALIFSSVVTAVKIANQDRIEINQKIKLQRTILTVLGLDKDTQHTPEQVSEIYNKRIKEGKIGDRTLYTCYSEDGKTVAGYAFSVDGPGFWGPVYAMAAVDADITKLIGVSFYLHSETPGLGGRISEKWFSDQFKNLSLETDGKDKPYFFLTPEGDNKKKQ